MPDWPTAETRAIWMEFVQSFTPAENRTWSERRYWASVHWLGTHPPPGTPVQVHHMGGQTHVLAADATRLGTIQAALNPDHIGLVRSTVAADPSGIDIVYLGPPNFV